MILNILTIFNSVKAININSANIVTGGDCGSLLRYKGIVVKVHYAEYLNEGTNYPAYCLDKNKKGADLNPYTISIKEKVTDVRLWRIIINGYPYKSIEELGCNNKEEAFTATKQAIYCYIYGNNPNDYEAINEAGRRTLNALKTIVSNSNSCQENQISNNVTLNKESQQFEIDSINNKYLSKTYSIKANTDISNYKINLETENNSIPKGTKITDLNNNEKENFNKKEKFKILIPIKNLIEKGNFWINIKTTINSKPILFGEAEDSTYQDCALTCAVYEEAFGKSEECYNKNETKLKIIKQDENTKERLEGVEFNLYDENKNIIYANLKTDNNGEIKIKNMIPGKYFIQETNSKDGYLIEEKFIEIELKLNEEVSINITNKKEEKTVINMSEKQLEETIIKKLPVTGM